MGSVHIGIGHDNDAMITELVDIELIRADTGTQCRNQGRDLLGRKHFLVSGFFDVQHLAAQRQDRLEFAVSSLFCRTARRIPFDEIQFTHGRIFFLTVGQFCGKAKSIQNTFPACQFTCLACRFTGTGGLDDFRANDFCVVRLFLQEVGQGFRDDFLDRATDFGRDQLVFRLGAEFRFRDFYRKHTGESLTHIVAGNVNLGFFGQLVFLDVAVDNACHRGTQAGQMGTAITLRNIVRETKHLFVVRIVPLHRNIDVNRCSQLGHPFAGCLKNRRVQDAFAAIDIFDESARAAFVGKNFFLAGTLVGQANTDAIVQKRQFTDSSGENFKIVGSGQNWTRVPCLSDTPTILIGEHSTPLIISTELFCGSPCANSM